jgi:RNA polymerase sigma-70 factor (ECF subfamily)
MMRHDQAATRLTSDPFELNDSRALWLAQHILPNEAALRAQLNRWHLPHDLDPDDIVQDAYSRFATMAAVDHILNPRAYLFSVARTILLAHLRHARVVSIRALEENDMVSIADDNPSPEIQASDREQLHLLALAIAELPEPGRRAFMMRVLEGLSHQTIGTRLGMTDNAVQKSVAKTLVKLMAALGRGGKATAEASRKSTPQRTRDENG